MTRTFMRLLTGVSLLLTLPALYAFALLTGALAYGVLAPAIELSILLLMLTAISTFFVAPAFAWNAFDRGDKRRAAAWIAAPFTAFLLLCLPLIYGLISYL
jgi:hypothetical protein